MSLKTNIDKLKQSVSQLKDALKEKIEGLPQNPNITPVGKSGAFTMSMSEIMKDPTMIMSPEHYDFKYQYKLICNIIDETDATHLYDKLKKIVAEGTTVIGRRTFRFNPKVLEALEEVVDDRSVLQKATAWWNEDLSISNRRQYQISHHKEYTNDDNVCKPEDIKSIYIKERQRATMGAIKEQYL